MNKFPTPEEIEQQSNKHAEQLQELVDSCAAALLDNVGCQRVLVKFPQQIPQLVLDKLKKHIEASGWKVTFYNGQRDGNFDGTYNLEIKKA